MANLQNQKKNDPRIAVSLLHKLANRLEYYVGQTPGGYEEFRDISKEVAYIQSTIESFQRQELEEFHDQLVSGHLEEQ